MQQTLLLLLFGVLFGCAGDRASQQTQTNDPVPSSEGAAPAPTATNTTANGQFTIYFANQSAKTGETICVDVQVRAFTKLLSMQYTVAWNKAVLRYKNLQNFNLPYLSAANFGDHITQDGLLTFAWLDNSLKSVSLPDGGAMYQICFEVISKSGEQSFVKITDRPTPIEVADHREQLIPMKREAGIITIE
ncbi:MAG TPA: cohesin domain-containing protein [Saprospiraceae bacterium]|nr:cohesin domain-containing protein [Saprospiraceae bacterium]HMP26149.1 cohesin domain-containing protein [Saprospiraceae bacterium]